MISDFGFSIGEFEDILPSTDETAIIKTRRKPLAARSQSPNHSITK